jgi:protocatechuate 3,4-dioxygenase beta subunit
MENDDKQVGRIIGRMDALKVLGIGSVALLAACTPPFSMNEQEISPSTLTPSNGLILPSCVVRPALTEGPYFVDERLNRSDIRSDPTDGFVKAGLLLNLKFHVSEIGNKACSPLSGAQVDVGHCDALGIYSDAQDPGFDTKGKKFLRGYQLTDATGVAQFTTIYPGWYPGRAVHIHFKIRIKSFEFTSQLFFDDSLTDQVHAQLPYSQKGPRSLRNEGDSIYQSGGSQLLLPVTPAKEGYAGLFNIGLQMQ